MAIVSQRHLEEATDALEDRMLCATDMVAVAAPNRWVGHRQRSSMDRDRKGRARRPPRRIDGRALSGWSFNGIARRHRASTGGHSGKAVQDVAIEAKALADSVAFRGNAGPIGRPDAFHEA